MSDHDTGLESGPKSRRPSISIALGAFGIIAIVAASIFLGGSFYIGNEFGKAFCLGAFFCGLIGAMLLFGFAKVIELLEAIRIQTRGGRGGVIGDQGF